MYEDNNGRVILVCLVFKATVTYIVCQVCLRYETYPLASTDSIRILTPPMLRLLSSKAQGRKYF